MMSPASPAPVPPRSPPLYGDVAWWVRLLLLSVLSGAGYVLALWVFGLAFLLAVGGLPGQGAATFLAGGVYAFVVLPHLLDGLSGGV